MRRAIKAPTKAEQAYQDAARALGCVVCRWRFAAGLQRGIGCGPVRIHHRNIGDLHGQKQIGQHAVVALGDYHHQGTGTPDELRWVDRAMASMHRQYPLRALILRTEFTVSASQPVKARMVAEQYGGALTVRQYRYEMSRALDSMRGTTAA